MYFGGQAQLLVKKFGGFTSEVGKEIIEESLDQNQHLQDYLHFERISRNIISEEWNKKMCDDIVPVSYTHLTLPTILLV